MRAYVDFGPQPASGGEARFGLALDWIDEALASSATRGGDLASEACLVRADTPDGIADELGLGAGLTAGQLTARWRKFVWRNHPDRQPKAARERANARVAIANALYEQAQRELARGR
jgi:hypothetical protein